MMMGCGMNKIYASALHDASVLGDYCNKLSVLRAVEMTDLGSLDEVLERYFRGTFQMPPRDQRLKRL
jgi:hypothetical protein